MSDIEKIFSHAPKDAVKLGVLRGDRRPRWFNKNGDCFSGNACNWVPTEHECVTLAVRPEQQKTVAGAEQEGEKWTHTWYGNRCRVLFTEDYRSWVRGPALDKLVSTDELKPIKPTLTKEQAWDYAVDSGLTAEEIEKIHTVV